MAYVRKVRTASGAVAVQVARKDGGRVVILAHLGSAHTDAELGILLEQARQVVVGGQAALDFEVSVRAQSMTDVADFRERSLIDELSGPSVAAPSLSRPARSQHSGRQPSHAPHDTRLGARAINGDHNALREPILHRTPPGPP